MTHFRTFSPLETTDKKGVKKNFEQILREKMHSSPSKNSSFSDVSDSFPSHLAYLMGQIPQRNFQRKSAVYPRGTANIPFQKDNLNPTMEMKPKRPAHLLEGLALEAFQFFARWGQPLDEGFSKIELKAAFRKLALKLHPDQKGESFLFMQLRDAFRTLSLIPTLK